MVRPLAQQDQEPQTLVVVAAEPGEIMHLLPVLVGLEFLCFATLALNADQVAR